jgi:hypothetical protein
MLQKAVQLFLFVKRDMQAKSKHPSRRVVSFACCGFMGQHDTKINFHIADAGDTSQALRYRLTPRRLAIGTDRKV